MKPIKIDQMWGVYTGDLLIWNTVRRTRTEAVQAFGGPTELRKLPQYKALRVEVHLTDQRAYK